MKAVEVILSVDSAVLEQGCVLNLQDIDLEDQGWIVLRYIYDYGYTSTNKQANKYQLFSKQYKDKFLQDL